jgi:hypothetical protein
MWCVAVWLAAMVCGAAFSQEAAPAKKPPAKPPAKAPAKAGPAAAPVLAPKSPYRKLAPGVMEGVNPDAEQNQTINSHDAVELLTVDSNFDWAKEVSFRHDVWTLKFSFKPVRMMWIDVPGNNGQMRRKLIWYMIYTVTNPGKTMHPAEQPDGTYKVEFLDEPVRFIPIFTLVAHNRLDENAGFTKAYVDHLIPVALAPIGAREDRNRQFLSTVEMSRDPIPVGKTLWGIVTWEDVDPRTKWFSIYVEGLTNAYRWKDQPGTFTQADFGKAAAIGKGRRLGRKTLCLNFWRPSDEYFESEREIRYGVPGRVDYEWVYQ